MTQTQPLTRLKYTEKEIERYSEDSEETWKVEHDELRSDCWVWEKIIAKAIDIFDGITELDLDVCKFLFAKDCPPNTGFEDSISRLLRGWVSASERVIVHIQRLEKIYPHVEGATEFRERFKIAVAELTSDSVYFADGKLDAIGQTAIEEVRAGNYLSSPERQHA